MQQVMSSEVEGRLVLHDKGSAEPSVSQTAILRTIRASPSIPMTCPALSPSQSSSPCNSIRTRSPPIFTMSGSAHRLAGSSVSRDGERGM